VNLSKDVTATGNLSLASTNNDHRAKRRRRAAGNGDDYRCRRYGAVTLDKNTNQLGGAITSTGTGAVTIDNSVATQLGAIGATGVGNAAASLRVTTSNDAVTQTADAFVAGATIIDAGTGDVTSPAPAMTSRERSRSPAARSASAMRAISTSSPEQRRKQVDHRLRPGHALPAGWCHQRQRWKSRPAQPWRRADHPWAR
jgi:hypothetical protein